MFTTMTIARSWNNWLFAVTVILTNLSGCKPEITSFTPTSGRQGDAVTINGKNFDSDPTKDTVRFGATLAEITGVPTDNMILTKVPAGAATGVMSVTTKHGTGSSQLDFGVTTPKKWTLLIYLDADNNLESDGITDFLEMASIGSTPAMNIVVQMDRIPGYSNAYGDWTDTRRFLIHRNDTPASTPVEILGEMNMGDPAVLQDFVTWGVTRYPAEHYGLVIWNHGGGWKIMKEKLATMRAGGDRSITGDRIFKEVSYDDTNNDLLYMREVQTALASSRLALQRTATFVKLDIVGFDACLMGMVEVGYALRDCANFMVGSEELEPGSGWPYDKILSDLANNPTMSPAELSKLIVAKYVASYSPAENVTLSALDLSKIVPLANALDIFSGVARNEWDRLKAARGNTHQYHISGWPTLWGTDLRGFASNVANTVTGLPLKAAASAVYDAAGECVIAEGHGQAAQGSYGLALYFPPDKSHFDGDPDHGEYVQGNQFMTVDFVQQHLWDEWLQIYYTNTMNIP